MLRQAARAHNNLAALLSTNVGDLEAARAHWLQAAELSRQRGAVESQLWAESGAFLMDLLLGAFAAADERLPSRRRLLDAIHDPGSGAAAFQSNELLLLRYRGEVEEAIDRTRPLQTDLRAAGDLQLLSILDIDLADALFELGEEEEAEAALQEAIAIGEKLTFPGGAQPRCVMSAQHSRRGEIEPARRLLSEAREKDAELGSRALDSVWLSWAQAHLAAAEGRYPEALGAFKETVDRLSNMGMRWYRARSLQEWADVCLSSGDPADRETAGQLLHEAVAEFEDMGAPFYAAQVAAKLQTVEESA
jgi:tetratricopeptide (TPR) repeat protein